MKKRLYKSLTLLAFASTLSIAHAGDLKTHAEFGFTNTSGNTDTTSYALNLDLKDTWGKHLVNFMFSNQYAEDSGSKTINKLLTELNYNYALNDKLAFSYLLGYKNDTFSDFKYQGYTGPGLEYKILQDEVQNLSIGGSILYSQDKLMSTNSIERYSALRVSGAYQYIINENVKFTQDLSMRSSFENTDNYFAYSKTALISKLSDTFSLGLNYTIDYVNLTPTGTQHSDRTLSANLIVDF